MPITRRQFELAVDRRIKGWMKKIHAFLAERKDEAFNSSELKKEFLPYLRAETSAQLHKESEKHHEDERAIDLAIEKLAQLRATEERVISGISYYVYRGPLVLGDSEKRPPF